MVHWTTFEGAKRGGAWDELLTGVYYGQTFNGERDGYGLLYCSCASGWLWLYECFWLKGKPAG